MRDLHGSLRQDGRHSPWCSMTTAVEQRKARGDRFMCLVEGPERKRYLATSTMAVSAAERTVLRRRVCRGQVERERTGEEVRRFGIGVSARRSLAGLNEVVERLAGDAGFAPVMCEQRVIAIALRRFQMLRDRGVQLPTLRKRHQVVSHLTGDDVLEGVGGAVAICSGL